MRYEEPSSRARLAGPPTRSRYEELSPRRRAEPFERTGLEREDDEVRAVTRVVPSGPRSRPLRVQPDLPRGSRPANRRPAPDEDDED